MERTTIRLGSEEEASVIALVESCCVGDDNWYYPAPCAQAELKAASDHVSIDFKHLLGGDVSLSACFENAGLTVYVYVDGEIVFSRLVGVGTPVDTKG